MLWSGCWENNLKEGINMIKFTDFIKDFTEGKDLNRIKVKFNISDEQYPALDLLYNEKNSKNDS